jgi:predicted DNA-binding transcriptional regulator AlpA
MVITGYGKSEIWRKAADPNDDFPAPVRLSPKVSAWLEDEIIEWQNRRIAERDARIAERKATTDSRETQDEEIERQAPARRVEPNRSRRTRRRNPTILASSRLRHRSRNRADARPTQAANFHPEIEPGERPTDA